MFVAVWNMVPDCAMFLSRTGISVKAGFLLSSLEVQCMFLHQPLSVLVYCIWKSYLPDLTIPTLDYTYLFATFFITPYTSGYQYVIDELTMK